MDLLETIRFGASAVFGEDVNKNPSLPTKAEISLIIDRTRSENKTEGKLRGGMIKTGKDFDVSEKYWKPQDFDGVDFKKLREENLNKLKRMPKQLQAIADHWDKDVQIMENARKKQNRILLIEGKGSGYGSALIPVLASNNYELKSGECSVFARELKHDRSIPVLKTTRNKTAIKHHSDCQICGLRGRNLIQCPRCPVSLHPQCLGFSDLIDRKGKPHKISYCAHHQCKKCGKKKHEAGGILFPCQSCPDSFCEDCLPSKEEGLRFLYTTPPRFSQSEFSNDNHDQCYIHCSKQCEKYAIENFNWVPPDAKSRVCPAPLHLDWA